MTIGQGNVFVLSKQSQSGAPFAAGAANNGLSVDGVSGKIVLGEDFASGSGLADLLSNRDINFAGFLLHLFKAGLFDLYFDSTPVGSNDGVIRLFGDFLNAGYPGKIFFADNSSNESGQAYLFQPDGTMIVCQRNSIDAGLTGFAISRRNVRVTAAVETPPAIVPNAILQADGGIATSDPGSGQGVWQLGKRVAGAVALDAANYIEVKIDGVVVKLGIVV